MSKDFIRKRSSPVSNAEHKIVAELLQRGERMLLTQQEFCLLSTKPDIFFPDINLAVYIDGDVVHLDRQDKDAELRRLLKKRYGCKIRVLSYKAPLTKARQKEIVDTIIDDCIGYRRK